MVVGEPNVNNIMGGIQNTGGVRLHIHRKKLKQRFDIIKKLGQGTYGKVQLGINKETGQEVAIKTIKKSKIETEADLIRIRREIQIMSSVQHPNIIHIYEVFENREKMVLVMEYAAGGELYDYLSERKILVEEEARRIFRQISTACYYCHKHKICHRDLKLENILLDEHGNAKIADFGLSNVFDDQRLLATFCGSPLYASPEIVKGTPYQGPEVDCWSLGVLLYTLVYGAMPFDGSNFKRLVKQISQGDYFEPKKPSRASPLIREMLTVNPRSRANIEKICAHWWVNEGYDDSCLEISEDLANQTPVRLDLLLSLAPPPPQLESEKLLVTGEIPEESTNAEGAAPTRSQSVGSIMELSHAAERRIKEMMTDEAKVSPKRKLETTGSTDQANLSKEGVKRKEKIVKENTVADITVKTPIQENPSLEDASMAEAAPLNKSLTQTLSREMDVEQTEEYVDPSTQGATCAEIIEEAKKIEAKKPLKVKQATSNSVSNKPVEEIKVQPSQESVANNVDKENVKEISKESQPTEKLEDKQKTEESKIPAKRKVIKKKVLGDKNENSVAKPVESAISDVADKSDDKRTETKEQKAENLQKTGTTESKVEDAQPPNKPVERRRSRIFETAEKFQSMISANETVSKPTAVEKPKKLVIPGVSVGGFKKEFERKASLTSTSPPKVKNNLSKKNVSVDKEKSVSQDESANTTPVKKETKVEIEENVQKPKEISPIEQKESGEVTNATAGTPEPVNDERRKQVKNAVNIISSVLDKEGTRKSKSRPCIRKPPVPFGVGGRSASGSIGMMSSPLSPPLPEKFIAKRVTNDEKITPEAQTSLPAQVLDEENTEESPEENKTSSVEITLKSATLPRRRTTKAEIQLDYPVPKPATMEFKTEMAHRVVSPPKLPTQRSEITVPILSPKGTGMHRSASVDAESKVKQSPRERIIPISFEKVGDDVKENAPSPPVKAPASKILQNQRSPASQRSSSLSRQSTLESDSETTISGEPIRKSPREYIIPIAVEGGGYVTPRAGSLEPSDTTSTASNLSKSKFNKPRRMSSLLSDREGSEDESPFGALHRHSSFGRDSDTEDPRRDMFRMHSLRSSRPRKAKVEHNDSFSSGEDDDDDGFEILTAENLFSTLLSRVRDLTQRLNVDDRPGFPGGRLLSHFDHNTNFWNLHNRMEPLSRRSPLSGTLSRDKSTDSSASTRQFGTPWRRSVSRDLASDIESVFNSPQTPTHTATLPRGDKKEKKENLNLADLDLKKLKLSDEDALALSYLTPGLSRRIQKQLLAQLPTSEARKLSRTLSMKNSKENCSYVPYAEEHRYFGRRSADPVPSTLPRRYTVDRSPLRSTTYQSVNNKPGNKESALDQKSMYPNNKPIETLENLTRRPYDVNKNFKSSSDNILQAADINLATKESKSSVPVRSLHRDYTSPYNDCSTKYDDFESRKSIIDHNSDLSEHSSYDNYLKNRPSKAVRSTSLRDSKAGRITPNYDNLQSPDSSVSESLSYKNDSHSLLDKSFTNPDSDSYSPVSTYNSLNTSSNYDAESSRLSKYLSPTKYYDASSHSLPSSLNDKNKDDVKSSGNKRISRFLRPDFFDGKEANYYLKEKKEREMETQKVLKEIRDKRKTRLRRDRSASRETHNAEAETTPVVSSSSEIINKNTQKVESSVLPEIKNYYADVTNRQELYATTNNSIQIPNVCKAESTENLLKNVSDNIKNLESNVKCINDYVNVKNTNNENGISKIMPDYVNVTSNSAKASALGKTMPDYVNVNSNTETNPVVKKERVSKLARPKSYPAEGYLETKPCTNSVATASSPEKETKSNVSKLKKPEKGKEKQTVKDAKKTSNSGEKQSNKSRFLQTIEKKFEKLRSFNTTPTSVTSESSDDTKSKEDRKSNVEDKIKRLREQSLPRTTDHCITESGLIKRAVSVEDFTTLGSDSKHLQPSRKSVTKILNLFKKYEDKNGKKSEKSDKVAKSKKSKESTRKSPSNSNKNKTGQLDSEKTDKHDIKTVGAETVIMNNHAQINSDINVRNPTKILTDTQVIEPMRIKDHNVENTDKHLTSDESANNVDTKERPRSLLLDRVKRFQPSCSTAKSDSNIINDEVKRRTSKLPVNTFRRSLNLENGNNEQNKYGSPNINVTNTENQQIVSKNSETESQQLNNNVNHLNNEYSEQNKTDRKNLRLDFSQIRKHNPSETNSNQNRNSIATTDSSVFLSPCEDNDFSGDSWSICSDFHTHDLTSPVSPSNHFYSADENESVIDRIRRKSFYSRFNEKKRPRKSTLSSNYKDLDIYTDRKSGFKSPTDLALLGRRSVELGSSKINNYSSSKNDPILKGQRTYGRNSSALNDGYVNVPNRYQTLNPKIGRRHTSSFYSPDSEELNALDDVPTAGKSKTYSYHSQPSRFNSRSISPTNEQSYPETISSSIQQIS